MKSVAVLDIINKFPKLMPLTTNHNLEKEIIDSGLTRPGLELTGCIAFFSYRRIQILGMQEINYLETIDYNEKQLEKFLNPEIPLIIICRGLQPHERFIEMCNMKQIALYHTELPTSKVFSEIYNHLEYVLAPEVQIHGVLVSIFGHGVLIKGASGIGKSEIGLELIARGHFLIADDAVIISKIDEFKLIGSAPELLKNKIEIRGLGVLSIPELFGITKVLPSQKVDLVIELQIQTGREDRLGNMILKETILDLDIDKIVIPIHPGRNLAQLIEVAVANHQLKSQYNVDSTKDFIDNLQKSLKEKNGR